MCGHHVPGNMSWILGKVGRSCLWGNSDILGKWQTVDRRRGEGLWGRGWTESLNGAPEEKQGYIRNTTQCQF